jgi:hypothetical protein
VSCFLNNEAWRSRNIKLTYSFIYKINLFLYLFTAVSAIFLFFLLFLDTFPYLSFLFLSPLVPLFVSCDVSGLLFPPSFPFCSFSHPFVFIYLYASYFFCSSFLFSLPFFFLALIYFIFLPRLFFFTVSSLVFLFSQFTFFHFSISI